MARATCQPDAMVDLALAEKKEEYMTHIRTISRCQPNKAQFEPILQFVGLLNALVALISNVMDTFGIGKKQQ